MDKQTIANVASVIMIMLPVISISYLMTAKSPKNRAKGYYALSALLFLTCIGCFVFAVVEKNRAGYFWMGPVAYAAYAAWQKGRSLRAE